MTNLTQEEREFLRRLNGQGGLRKPSEASPNEVANPEEDLEARKESHSPQKTQPAQHPAMKAGKGFKDVAGMDDLKHLVTEGFINVIHNRECAKAFHLKPPSILLYGPSGCGKTFFAERMAEEVGIPFMKVVPHDLACTWIHGTQQKIGELFREAQKKAPVLLFFDEFDAMVPQRSGNEADQHTNGEVNEFLCMLNNASERGIYVLAATNNPERIDKAVLRPGRIDEKIYIDMPDNECRRALFQLELSTLPASDDIDYDELAKRTQGYNCSDITYIVQTASRQMFNESIKNAQQPYSLITHAQLTDIIARCSPSVSTKDLREFERMRSQMSPKDQRRPQLCRIGF